MVKALDVALRRRAGGARRGARSSRSRTLDLVVLAAEWGHGRRRGWLSNLHLGARDPETGEFVMVGKTFKGLTDELLTWQTERLQEIATRTRRLHVVYVRPELVVEIALDGVQVSTRYAGRRRAAVRARARVPPRQGRGRRRHDRRRPRAARAVTGSRRSYVSPRRSTRAGSCTG